MALSNLGGHAPYTPRVPFCDSGMSPTISANADLAGLATTDPHMAAKIARKREQAAARAARMCSPRLSRIGCDVVALNAQVVLKKAAIAEEADGDQFETRKMQLTDMILNVREEQRQTKARQKQQECVAYSLNHLRKDQRREYFLFNDPDELKKDRVPGVDSSKSSCQYFDESRRPADISAVPRIGIMRAVGRITRPLAMIGVSSRRMASTEAETVGFIGLGNMGAHMARNVLKTGRKVIAFDVNPAALADIAQSGGSQGSSPAEVAAAASTVITMLPSNPHVLKVYLDPKTGVLAGAKSGTFLIDSSTCEPTVSQQVAAAAKDVGCTYVDAPVSGGTIGAEQATLTFMVGAADEASFKKAEDLLQHLGKKTVHCGDVGTGQGAKICNNLVLGISMAAVCEGHALGARLGLDPKVLADILNTSTGRCWSSDTYNPCPGVMEGVPSSRGYTGGFAADLMAKDLGLATAAANSAKPRLGLPMGGLALQLYTLMGQHGAGGKDFSALYEFLEKKA